MNPVNGFAVDALQAQAGKVSAVLSALCNEKRLLILCELVAGETSVNEMARALGFRQSTLSQHLALLRHSSFVTARRVGQAQLYSLTDDDVRIILQTLQSLYCDRTAKDTSS